MDSFGFLVQNLSKRRDLGYSSHPTKYEPPIFYGDPFQAPGHFLDFLYFDNLSGFCLFVFCFVFLSLLIFPRATSEGFLLSRSSAGVVTAARASPAP